MSTSERDCEQPLKIRAMFETVVTCPECQRRMKHDGSRLVVCENYSCHLCGWKFRMTETARKSMLSERIELQKDD